MAYQTKTTLNADATYVLGGADEKTGKLNPTSVEGYFLGNRTTPDKGYGPGVLHIFQTSEGNIGIWGKTNSKSLLTNDHVGQMCLLTFTGMSVPKKKGRQPAYQYKLQFDKDNTIDVSGIDVNASEESEPDFEGVDETSVDDGGAEAYSAPRATAPKVAATSPTAAQQAAVKAKLGLGAKTKNA